VNGLRHRGNYPLNKKPVRRQTFSNSVRHSGKQLTTAREKGHESGTFRRLDHLIVTCTPRKTVAAGESDLAELFPVYRTLFCVQNEQLDLINISKERLCTTAIMKLSVICRLIKFLR
jgi:hypothetical protein